VYALDRSKIVAKLCESSDVKKFFDTPQSESPAANGFRDIPVFNVTQLEKEIVEIAKSTGKEEPTLLSTNYI
jgi:hypothetical protein